MKKLIYLLLMLPLLAACSSGDDEKMSEPNNNNLVNTSWEHLEKDGNSHLLHTVVFSSNTELSYSIVGNIEDLGDINLKRFYAYTYEYPNLVLTPKTSTSTSTSRVLKGILNVDTLSIYYADTNNLMIEVIRKK